MFDKLNGMVKHLKEHDSTLFQPNGLTLKQGEEFAHDCNVEQIKCKQDMEMLEENKKSFHTIYKGIHKEHTRRGEERKKTEENQMKGRRSGMQTTSNECMESVLEAR